MDAFWDQDEDGYILNKSSLKKIPSEYLPLVEDIKDTYLKYASDQIHSIYLFGSVPRGLSTKGLSDIDCIAVLRSRANTNWTVNESKRIIKANTIISSMVFDFEMLEEVIQSNLFSWPVFLLSTSGVCIYGEDLILSMPKFKPSMAIANSELIQLKDNIDEAISEIQRIDSDENLKYWCRRIMKNLLRDGFFLNMASDGKFTSDVDLCYQEFAQHYPDLAPGMARALEFSKISSANKTEVIDLLNGFGQQLVIETDKWLDVNNPTRKAKLPLIKG